MTSTRPSRTKARHPDAGTSTSPESETKENYLQKLYTDPGRPGSFSGLNKLKQAIKEDGKHQFTDDQLKTELAKQDTYTVNRFVRRKFKRSRVVAYGINDLIDIDLADFSRLSRYNKKVRFLMVTVDTFSRLLRVHPMLDKSASSVLEALKSIYPAGSPQIQKIRTDLGLEFRNGKVKEFLKTRGIRHVFASPPIKAGYAERCIQSLKQLIYRYLYHSRSWTISWKTTIKYRIGAWGNCLRAKLTRQTRPLCGINFTLTVYSEKVRTSYEHLAKIRKL